MSSDPNLADMKAKVILDISGDRRAWRVTTIPQIVTLLILSIVLSALAAFGVYASVMTITDSNTDIATIKGGIQTFVTGSSSLLGFVVLRLFGKLGEMTRSFILEEKRFTSDKNSVEIATSRDDIAEVLKYYFRIE